MRITIIQTSVVIDIPEETAQPAPKPIHPLMLLAKALKVAEAEHDSTQKPPTQERFHGTFLT